MQKRGKINYSLYLCTHYYRIKELNEKTYKTTNQK